MDQEIIFYRRNLPHLHPKDGIFFITFRLAGSLPESVLQKLHEARESAIKLLSQKFQGRELEEEWYKIEKRFWGYFDKLLDDSTSGPQWLKEERIAKIVVEKIHELDGKRFTVVAYCVMSNHVHLLIDMSGYNKSSDTNVSGKTKDYPLTDAMRLLKGSTARRCNLELGRGGAFWHIESYDHCVRDENELARIIHYILNNPVKAGLVDDWRNWKFNHVTQH
jgi:REP element-mobilizing transposase RayT